MGRLECLVSCVYFHVLMRFDFTKVALGAGQSVADRVHREGDVEKNPKQFLKDVISWLLINSMRVDGIQFSLLCEQNVSNIWRKKALRKLLPNTASLDSNDCSSEVSRCVEVFRERVDFAVESSIPTPQKYSAKIATLIHAHRYDWLRKQYR